MLLNDRSNVRQASSLSASSDPFGVYLASIGRSNLAIYGSKEGVSKVVPVARRDRLEAYLTLRQHVMALGARTRSIERLLSTPDYSRRKPKV